MLGVMMIENEGIRKGIRLPMFNYTGKKILGYAKWDEGIEIVKRKARESDPDSSWVTKRDRPLGKDLYANNPIAILPRVGEVTETKLNEVGIFTVGDYINNKDAVESILDSNPAKIKKIKKLKDETAGGVRNGSCPEKYEKIDHRKNDNPYLSKYGDEWENRIS
ncbi:MAG: hypothetical protein MK076_11495, partial [Flavobacteriales bacterium]|nr:hypothetical protein [Flavobacteriales bacterium]